MNKVIAIDFDGTLFENRFPAIGEPRMHIIEKALEEQLNGADLVLWTCREGKLLDNALAACAEYGLYFSAVNDSTDEWKKEFDNSPRKIGASEYWDDKSINPDSVDYILRDQIDRIGVHKVVEMIMNASNIHASVRIRRESSRRRFCPSGNDRGKEKWLVRSESAKRKGGKIPRRKKKRVGNQKEGGLT